MVVDSSVACASLGSINKSDASIAWVIRYAIEQVFETKK